MDIGDKGLLDLLVDDAAVNSSEELQRELIDAGYEAKLLDREEVLALEPNLIGAYVGALWLDEPWLDREQYFSGLRVALDTAKIR